MKSIRQLKTAKANEALCFSSEFTKREGEKKRKERKRTKSILVFKTVSFQTLCERLAFGGQSRDERGLIIQGVF